MKILYLFLFFTLISSCKTSSKKNSEKKKTDIIIDTDLGGDPDDIQSLFRALHYSDYLNIKGIVSTPCTGEDHHHSWDTIPQDELIKEWVQRIDLDYLRSKGYTGLMPEKDVLNVVKKGSQYPGFPSKARKSEGSQWIIECAKNYSIENPLWIVVWGSMTSLAQALHDEPSIASNIRIYSIGTTNTQHDSLSRNYVFDFMTDEYPELWWIENGVLPKWSHETMRGVYQGGNQEGEWGNKEFIKQNIRGHGSTHNGMFKEKCGDAFPVATSPMGTLKEGDSPSILYLLSPVLAGVGDVDDPTSESWGGTFRKANPEKYPNYYIDLNKSQEECQATINRWRVDYLSHWKIRWDRYDNTNLSK